MHWRIFPAMWEVLVGSGSRFDSEVERRREAVRLVDNGVSVAETARRVGRSRWWVHQWLNRYRAEGDDGLVDRSRARKTQPAQTSPVTVAKILKIRRDFEDNPAASIGALSILAKMERDRWPDIPSIATIERILSSAGVTRPKQRNRRSGVRLPLPETTTPGVLQQADWIQDRYLTGGIRYQSLQIADVGSHGIASGQYLDRTILTAVTFLLEQAWPRLSIPQAMTVDNAFVKTTHKDNPFTNWTRACLYFGVEVVIGPPGRHGWTNHIEAVNNEWQNRTIRATRFTSLDDLRQGSDRAVEWLNTYRPILDPNVCGTRYPAEYINHNADTLRWPPTITITDHLNQRGDLILPVSEGRITFLRHVTEHHTINLAHTNWPIPADIAKGALVTATITTANKRLQIRHQGEPIARFDYPTTHAITQPYYPPAATSLLQHV